MKSILHLVAVLPFLSNSAFAQSTVNCNTVLGTKSVTKVPTTTVTSTASGRPTQLLALQSTVTSYQPSTSTSMLLRTRTVTVTDSTITDTFSTTTTLYEVQTMTNTQTTTTTTTQTSTDTSTSTTVIATTEGFRNIADTLNSDQLRRRAAQNPHGVVKRALQTGKVGAQAILATQFPAAVTCTKLKPNTNTKTVYTTLRPTTKIVPYLAKRITEVRTVTSTSTIIPNRASATSTDSSTSTVQTTVTTTLTAEATTSTTTTYIAPGPTLWDACKPANIWGPNFRANNIDYYAVNVANNGPGVGSDFQIMPNGAGSATECCNECQKLDICETFIFRPRSRNCFLLKHDGADCKNQFNHPNFILSKKGRDPGDGYVVGNGNCGYTYSGNSDSSVFLIQG